MFKIKKGDLVVVIAGRDKKKQGKVLRIFTKEAKALVEGICLVNKHVKPNPQQNVTGGIVKQEALIPLCKLALYNPSTQKKDKVCIKTIENGKRARYFKSTDELIDLV